MNNDITPEPFNPTNGPTLRIIPCQNGWSLLVSNNQYGVSFPSYVFNSPAELAEAVANLVQFGRVENPPEEIVGVAQRFRKLIADRHDVFLVKVTVKNHLQRRTEHFTLRIYADESMGRRDGSHAWSDVDAFFLEWRLLDFSVL